MGDLSTLTLPVNEIFATIQGEGYWTGTPAVFLRLQGCDVGCPWCDTKHTWALDHTAAFEELALDVICHRIRLAATGRPIRHVVITGGEPLMHDLSPLIDQLTRESYRVQIETSGTYPPPRSQCWLTVSPKINMPGKREIDLECLRRADEIKHVVGKDAHADQLASLIEQVAIGGLTGPPVYLQPVSMSSKATQVAMRQCYRRNWRLSLQTHKMLGIP